MQQQHQQIPGVFLPACPQSLVSILFLTCKCGTTPVVCSCCCCVAVQLNVFLAMSVALRQMAATQWPGMTDQGFGPITDLTHPAVAFGNTLSALHAPYSWAGFVMPLGLLYLYRTTAQQSPLGVDNTYITWAQVPSISTGLPAAYAFASAA